MAELVATWSANSRTRTKIVCYELSTSPSNNTSVMRADVYVNADSGWPITVDSTTFTATIAGNSKSWSFGRKTFGGGVDTYIGTHDVTVGHDTNGAGSASFRATHSGTFGGSSDTGTGSAGMTDFDRSPTTPSVTASARAVSGTSFSVNTWSGGVINSGPTVTWTLQRADNSAFTTNIVNVTNTTTSGAVLTASSLTANQTYYFRIRATNTDGTKDSAIITSNGVPDPPSNFVVSTSTTDAGKFLLSWNAPINTQGGIGRYDIFVNDVFVQSSASTTTTTIKSTELGGNLTPGTNYNFRVVSKNVTNFGITDITQLTVSRTANVQARSPGPPTAPTYGSNPNPPSKIGRNVTVAVASNADQINNNTPITGYFVQYQTATTSDGTYGSWSTPQPMTLSGGNYTYTYNLLAPAIWYKFRVYAKNSIVNTVDPSSGAISRSYYPDDDSSYTANFSAETTPLFVSSGGKRWTGSGWEPTQIAKRWDPLLNSGAGGWVDLSIAKRWDPSLNDGSGGWSDLS